MRLPFRLAVGIGRPADIGGEEASGGDAQSFRPEDHREAGMVEEIAADGEIGGDRDAERPQPVGRADARALQDGRAVVDPGTDHDLIGERRPGLPGRVDVSDTVGPAAGEEHALDHAFGADGEVAAADGRRGDR